MSPVTVMDVALAPTDGPTTQEPLPILYCETKLDSLFEASVHVSTALVAVVDLTFGLVGWAGRETVLPMKCSHFT